jgi:hypothetical protein
MFCDRYALADASVVLFTAKEAVNDHNGISFCAALVIVEAVCEIDYPQV